MSAPLPLLQLHYTKDQMKALICDLQAKIAQVRRHPVWLKERFNYINDLEGRFWGWSQAEYSIFLDDQMLPIAAFLREAPPA